MTKRTGSEPFARCIWPNCKQYAEGGVLEVTKLCAIHLPIVIYQGLKDDAVRSLVDRMQVDTPRVGRLPLTRGTIYYLKVGAHIKVGWTSDMSRRMRSYPPNSVLLATEPGTRRDERRRHRMLAAHRSHGNEWYVPAPSVLHHIDMVKGKYGEPDPAAFAAKPVEIPRPHSNPGGPRPSGWVTGHGNVRG